MHKTIRALLVTVLFLFPARVSAQANQQVGQNAGLTANASVEINARTLPKVVSLVGRDAKGRSIPFGAGFFVDPWTILTNYQIAREMVERQVKQIYGISLDQSAIYLIVYISADVERQVIFLDVREKGPEPIPFNVNTKIKEGDKAYLVNQKATATVSKEKATSDTSSKQRGLREIILPVSGESSGMPLLDELGRVVGMTVDPKITGGSMKNALKAKQLLAKLETYRDFMKTAQTFRADAPSEPSSSLTRDTLTEEREAGGLSAMQPQRAVSVVSTEREVEPIRSLSGSVLQGHATVKVQPAYPQAAKIQRVSGEVQVKVTINVRGEVIEAEVVSGPPLLQLTSLRAARQWRFNSTLFSGESVKVQGILRYNFTLQ